MDRKRRRKAGFTLIELMTVVIIVGILAVVAIPIYRAQVERARATEGEALLGSVLTGERVYYAEHGTFTTVKDDIGVEVAGHKYFTDYTVTAANANGFTAITDGVGDAAGMRITMTYIHTGENSGATITHGKTPSEG